MRLIWCRLALILIAVSGCVTDHMTPLSQDLEVALDEVPGNAVGFVALGDSGSGEPAQYAVAKAMARYCVTAVCQFGTLLGDNFYTFGVKDVDDPQWVTKFEQPYAMLPFKFYAALGNHDYLGSVKAQIDYTKRSKKWVMPDRYYRFRQKNVEIFAIDTQEFDPTQRAWLEKRLAESKAKWKIVYGHHPIYSYGSHGDSDWLVDGLLPLITRYKVDFYLCGHEHDQQVLTSEGLLQVVSGGGGVALRKTSRGARSLYAESTHGFTHVQIEGGKARLKMIRVDGTTAYEKELSK